MILLIDGYNLLRSIFHKEKGKLDKQRDQLIKLLGVYRDQQAEKIKQLIIVFDAGPDRHASREVHKGVAVMFSGQRRSADDWIVEYVAKHLDYDFFLVSDDQMLTRRCQNKNRRVTIVKTEAFYKLVQEKCVGAMQSMTTHALQKEGLQKYEHDDSDQVMGHQYALDQLMEEGSRKMQRKQDDVGLNKAAEQHGQSHKLSKKERQQLVKTKKLT